MTVYVKDTILWKSTTRPLRVGKHKTTFQTVRRRGYVKINLTMKVKHTIQRRLPSYRAIRLADTIVVLKRIGRSRSGTQLETSTSRRNWNKYMHMVNGNAALVGELATVAEPVLEEAVSSTLPSLVGGAIDIGKGVVGSAAEHALEAIPSAYEKWVPHIVSALAGHHDIEEHDTLHNKVRKAIEHAESLHSLAEKQEERKPREEVEQIALETQFERTPKLNNAHVRQVHNSTIMQLLNSPDTRTSNMGQIVCCYNICNDKNVSSAVKNRARVTLGQAMNRLVDQEIEDDYKKALQEF